MEKLPGGVRIDLGQTVDEERDDGEEQWSSNNATRSSSGALFPFLLLSIGKRCSASNWGWCLFSSRAYRQLEGLGGSTLRPEENTQQLKEHVWAVQPARLKIDRNRFESKIGFKSDDPPNSIWSTIQKVFFRCFVS